MSLEERIEPLLNEVRAELLRALDQKGPMASPHEGWAVILEEVDELWEHVRADTGRTVGARHEATQIAAMGVRYMLDLTNSTLTEHAGRNRFRVAGTAAVHYFVFGSATTLCGLDATARTLTVDPVDCLGCLSHR